MTAFRQQCWFCRKSIRVDQMDWQTIRVGWTGQKPDDVGVMVHPGCAVKAEANRKHYEELTALIKTVVAAFPAMAKAKQ